MRRLLSFLAATLVAGCLAEDGERFGAHDQPRNVENPGYPGLVVSGKLTGSGTQLRVDAVAENRGPHTYKVSAICAPIWMEEMRQGSKVVAHREPMAYCEAFGLREFKPGEKIRFNASWDGTLWNDERRAYEPAPAGEYDWVLLFEVFKGGAGVEYESRQVLRLAFDVTVAG